MLQPSAAREPGYRPLAFLLAAIAAVGPFCIDAYLPSMIEISRVFGVPMTVVQQTLTAYMVPFAVMTLWHGALSDAVGRRGVVLGALALFTVASVGCALAWSMESLIVFRALQGMTAGAGMVVGRAIVRDLRDGSAAQRMMSLVSIVFALAPAVAPVIGGGLQHWFGWRSVFVFMASFSTAVLAWSWFALPESLPRDKRQSLRPAFLARSYARALTNVRFAAATAAIAFAFSGLFIYVLSAPAFLMDHLQLAETQFIWLFGPITLGLVGGAFLSGRLAGRLSRPRTVLLGFAMMGIAAASNTALNLAAGPGLPWSVAPLFGYSLGMALMMPSMTLMALDLFPAQRGLAASCLSFLHSSANSVNAALIAPLFWATPLRLAIGESLLFSLGALSVAVFLARPGVLLAKANLAQRRLVG